MAKTASVSTYSFLDVEATFTGPGAGAQLSFSLTEGGVAEEGITVEAFEDKNVMLTGADGSVQHSLRAATPCSFSITVMRNNQLHNKLYNAFNIQTSSSKMHGFNTVVITDNASGETVTITGLAFKKIPKNVWAKDAQPIQWEFDGGNIISVAGLNDGSTEEPAP